MHTRRPSEKYLWYRLLYVAPHGDKAITSKNGLLTTIACNAKGEPEYALEGSVFIAGASIQWLRDELKIVHDSHDSEYFAQKVPDSNGVYVVPAFTV